MSLAVQRSFDDLGTPLFEVTFCVVDLETTGGSPRDCAITEIGAIKLQGGRCLGRFQTLVNPGSPIPPAITVLTGISEQMVLPAPRIDSVLPAFLEFCGDAVVVGHNVRFDVGFLDAALRSTGRPPMANRTLDTAALARRLVRDEVPDCRLGTLASRLRLDHQPSHRALDDALATGDLLHLLLERAGRLAVTGLDDLLALPTIRGHEQVAKLRLTEHLPRSPGVYAFRSPRGEVLYVGKATDLRSRVRSYFSGDSRRKVGRLLRETARIDHEVTPTTLHAAVRELRLIQELEPRYNQQGKRRKAPVFLTLTRHEAFPRFSVVRRPRPQVPALGPLPSASAARRIAEAIETVVPLRRCRDRPGAHKRSGPCTPAQLGVATCPCAGDLDPVEYARVVARAEAAFTSDPLAVLEPLSRRMAELAAAQRFEEAADVRDRGAALAAAVHRQRRLDAWRRAGRVVLEIDGVQITLAEGLLQDDPSPVGQSRLPGLVAEPGALPPAGHEARRADEILCVARWCDQQVHRVRLVFAEHGLASPLPRLPELSPRRSGPASMRDR